MKTIRNAWSDARATLCLVALTASSPLLPAATFIVTSTADDGTAGSLSWAITSANASLEPGPHTIDLGTISGTILLTGPLPTITTDLLIAGDPQSPTTIDGDETHRVFWVDSGATLMRAIRIVDGCATALPAGPGGGGGAGMGGGLFINTGATVTLENVTFEGCTAKGSAGEPGHGGGGGGMIPPPAPITTVPTTRPNRTGAGDTGKAGVSTNGKEDGGIGGYGTGGLIGTNGTNGTGGMEFQGGGAGGKSGQGGKGQKGGTGGRGYGTCSTVTAAGKGGPGGQGGSGGLGGNGGRGGHGGFGAGGGAGGGNNVEGAGGSGGSGGAGGQYLVLFSPCGRKASGSTGVPGGRYGGSRTGHGGNGGYGGGGGGAGNDLYKNSPDGGINSFGNSGNAGIFGGDPGAQQVGGGAGLGGGIFIREGATLAISGGCAFINNEAVGGNGRYLDPTRANEIPGGTSVHGKGRGAGIFKMPGATMNLLHREPTLSGNLTTNGGSGSPGAEDIYGAYDMTDIARNGLFYFETPEASRNSATFRFLETLYEKVGVNDPQGRFSEIDTLFSDTDRADAQTALEEALERYRSTSVADEGLMALDVLQAFLVADLIVADNLLSQLDESLLRPALDSSIANQIETDLAAANGRLRLTLDRYFVHLADEQFHGIFKTMVPSRPYRSATYLDESMTPQPVDPAVSDTGTSHRDYALVWEALARFARHSLQYYESKVAYRLESEEAAYQAELADLHTYLYFGGNLLLGLFPEFEPDAAAQPGLAVSIQEWRDAQSRIESLQNQIATDLNPLGFDRNALIILPVAAVPDGGEGFLPSTFERYVTELDPNSIGTPLGSALSELAEAEAASRDFYQSKIQFEAARDNLRFEYSTRLAEIGDEDSGEIQQQISAIEAAENRLEFNQVRFDSTFEQIKIEITRNSTLKGINRTIADIKIRRINSENETDLLDTLGGFANIQEAAFGVGHSFSRSRQGGGLTLNKARLLTAGLSFGAGILGVQLEQDTGQLAVDEQNELVDQDNAKLDAELAAIISKLYLEQKAIAIDSKLAAINAAKELSRLVGLLEEQADLQCRIAGLDEALADRQFASPSYRLISQSEVAQANLAFHRARLRLFFMARALEYRWNREFENDGVTIESLFAMRNADELSGFYDAMIDFEADQDTGDSSQGLVDDISVREAVLGYLREAPGAPPLLYTDPASGLPVDAITAFRSRLSQMITTNGTNTELRIPFSTIARLRNADTLFAGPVPGTAPPILGFHSDKIAWLTVMLQGDFADITAAEADPSIIVDFNVPMALSYGGSTLLRQREVGTYDPVADEYRGEYRLIDARTLDLSLEPPTYLERRVSFKPARRYQIGNPILGDKTAIPSENHRIHSFNERSVAASDWDLVLTVENLSGEQLDFAELFDIIIRIKHFAGTTRIP